MPTSFIRLFLGSYWYVILLFITAVLVALLYKLIKDNNLDFKETLSNINNEEITSALNILLNTNNAPKKEHMDLINNNNLALTIFSEEQQEEKEKANEDDSILLK